MDAPPAVRAQLNELTNGLRTILADALVGVYVHGSLALGCFNGARSDIDVLAIVARTLSQDERQAVVDVLLQASGAPFGMEADVLTIEPLRNWRHPSPFELHFWEGRRDEWALDPLGTHASLATENPDLAAHVTIARAAGIALIGPPPAEVFPLVPEADLRDSLLRDLDWSRTAGVNSAFRLARCRPCPCRPSSRSSCPGRIPPSLPRSGPTARRTRCRPGTTGKRDAFS